MDAITGSQDEWRTVARLCGHNTKKHAVPNAFRAARNVSKDQPDRVVVLVRADGTSCKFQAGNKL